MRTKIKVATATCTMIVALGMIGCGGGSTPATPPTGGGTTVIPDYAKKVDMDISMAKKALNLVDDGTVYGALSANMAVPMDDYGIKGGIYFGGGTLSKMMSLVFERLGFFGGCRDLYGKYAKALSSVDEGELNITVPCAYSGDYVLNAKWYSLYGDDVVNLTEDITFNNCVHNTEINVMGGFTSGRKYTYSGTMKFDMNGTRIGSTEHYNYAIDVSSFSFKRIDIATNIVRNEVTADLTADIEWYRAWSGPDIRRSDIAFDGNMEGSDYNSTGGKEDYFKVDAKEFTAKAQRNDVLETKKIEFGGYTFVAPDMNESHSGFLYGENFIADYTAEGDMHTTSYNGVIGSKCLGGSVEFSTAVVWDTNESMPDIGVPPTNGTTPYIGTTTIAGANGTAIVQFAPIAGKAAGTIIMEGDVTIPTPMTLPEMKDENCTIF